MKPTYIQLKGLEWSHNLADSLSLCNASKMQVKNNKKDTVDMSPKSPKCVCR